MLSVAWKRDAFALDWDTAEHCREVPAARRRRADAGGGGAGKWVDRYVGEPLQGLASVPTVVPVAVVAPMVLLLTELTSNTATEGVPLPIVAGVAVGIGASPLLAIPEALAASCAFMLPVATPPTASSAART